MDMRETMALRAFLTRKWYEWESTIAFYDEYEGDDS